MSVDPRARLRALRFRRTLPTPMRRRAPHSSRRRGQAVVEFALILPVFLFLVVMAIDFGRLFFTYIQVHNAAREGANYGQAAPNDLVGSPHTSRPKPTPKASAASRPWS